MYSHTSKIEIRRLEKYCAPVPELSLTAVPVGGVICSCHLIPHLGRAEQAEVCSLGIPTGILEGLLSALLGLGCRICFPRGQ